MSDALTTFFFRLGNKIFEREIYLIADILELCCEAASELILDDQCMVIIINKRVAEGVLRRD